MRAAKIYLPVSCWFTIWMGLLMDGPAVVAVPTATSAGPTPASSVWTAVGSVILACGVSAVGTAILTGVVLTALGWIRRQRGEKREKTDANATTPAGGE